MIFYHFKPLAPIIAENASGGAWHSYVVLPIEPPPIMIVPPGSFEDVDFSRIAPGHIIYVDA